MEPCAPHRGQPPGEGAVHPYRLSGAALGDHTARNAQAMDARVYQYRDNTGLEVDAVVDAGMGRWAAFEVKLGTGRIDSAAASLLRFADRVDTSRRGEPATLGVIVHSGYGYTRPDGVAVIPAGSLGP